MTLTKKLTDKKVNFEFNKEYIKVLTEKIDKNDAFFSIFSCKESRTLNSGPLDLKNISGFLLIVPTAEQGASIIITSYFLLLSN